MSEQNIPLKVSTISLAAVVSVATFCALYAMSQFLRNSVAVIAPDLVRDIHLTAAELGLLSSAYFLMFGIAQIPLGIALDRFGPKPCLLASASIAVLGCAVFALAQSPDGLVLGRLLMGLGTASFLMAPLAIYARWFAPAQFSTMTGIQTGIGTLGALLATAPLAFAAGAFGWRATFLGIGALTFAIIVLVWGIVREHPTARPGTLHQESWREAIGGVWRVMQAPGIGRLFLLQMTGYPTYLLVVGLWGGPYLAHVYGLDLQQRGEILFVPALAQVIGSVFWGAMDRVFGRYKPPVLLAAAGTFLSLVLLAGIGSPPLPLLIILLAVLGFATGFVPLILGQAKAQLPPQLLGRALTLLNIGAMGGGFLVQYLSGELIGQFQAADGVYPLVAYQLVFGLQAALLLGASMIYIGARDARHGS
jgi:MFS family permease